MAYTFTRGESARVGGGAKGRDNISYLPHGVHGGHAQLMGQIIALPKTNAVLAL